MGPATTVDQLLVRATSNGVEVVDVRAARKVVAVLPAREALRLAASLRDGAYRAGG